MAIEIVDFPINSMVIFHCKMLVHQRVISTSLPKYIPVIFPWNSHGLSQFMSIKINKHELDPMFYHVYFITIQCPFNAHESILIWDIWDICIQCPFFFHPSDICHTKPRSSPIMALAAPLGWSWLGCQAHRAHSLGELRSVDVVTEKWYPLKKKKVPGKFG